MSKVTIEALFPPTTEKDLFELEQHLEITLPTDYKAFLLEHNGGKPEPEVFPVVNNPYDDKSMLHYFFGVTDGEIGNLLEYAQIYADKLPQDLIPIGIDLGGNLLCLTIMGANRGKVYFWDHDIPEGENEIFFVADSFAKLLESFRELDE